MTLGRDALVDTLSKPNIRVNIPGIQEELCVRGELDAKDVDVRCTLPEGLSRRPEPSETKSSQDTCSLKETNQLIAC